jgi:glycosyltransferase involved in cell wall biosynthesis
LIRAFSEFLLKNPQATLHIVGSGPEYEPLRQLISNLALEESIFLIGNRTDLPTLLHQYDCFIMPSLSEGFSGALIEALMAHLPILASKIPANQEIIKHLETGYLFEADSITSIVEALFWFESNRQLAWGLASEGYYTSLMRYELSSIASSMEMYLDNKIKTLA